MSATLARYTDGVSVINSGAENTDRIRNNQFQQPAFAATLNLSTYASFTLIKPATLTGVVTINLATGSSSNPPYIGDVVTFLFTPDGTTRVVTFGTGFLPTAATQSVTTAKQATATFMWNGLGWIETGRSISA